MTQTNFWINHPNKDEFSRNRSSSCPDILQKLNRYSQNIDGWVIQKSVQLMPRKSKKKLDEFSRNRSAPRPRKLKFRKKFWMSFPGFANKGKSLAYIIDAAMVLILILEGFRLWFKRRRTFWTLKFHKFFRIFFGPTKSQI